MRRSRHPAAMSGSTSSQLFPPDTDVPVEIGPRAVPPVLNAALEGRATAGAGEHAAPPSPVTDLRVEINPEAGPAAAARGDVPSEVAALPQANTVEPGPEKLVVVSTGSAPLEIGPPEIGAPTLREKKAGRSPRARTTIGKALLKNRAEIELIAASFSLLIDEKLDALRQQRSNSDEAHREIAGYEELKRKVDEFIAAASGFAVKKTTEPEIVETTTSLAAGIGKWWSESHVSFCEKAANIGLLGIGVAICSLAGASGAFAVGVPAVMVGGKPIVEAIKALRGRH
jgi:hypothetical protein